MKRFLPLLALFVFLSPLRAADVGLQPWVPSYAPVPAATITGIQGLLKTDAGQALLSDNPALAFLSRLDPESEAHRRVVAALGLPEGFEARLTPEALASVKENAAAVLALSGAARLGLPGGVASEIDKRVADVLEALDKGLDVAQLDAAARELAPFEGYAKHDGAALIVKMAAAAREEGTLDAAKRLAENLDFLKDAGPKDYGWQAVELMNEHGRDIGPSLDSLRQFSNERQLDALKVLLDHGYQISDKAPYLLEFNNEHQVAALRSMVEADRDVRPSLETITRFDNPHQAQAVDVLVSHGYQISDKIDDVAAIKGPLPVKALELMAERGRQIQPSMAAIAQISHERQVEAIKTLLEGSNASITYPIADKMESILRFDNDDQLGALRALVARAFPVRQLLPNLERVKTPEHRGMIGSFAANVQKPRVTQSKAALWISRAALVSTLGGLLTMASGHPWIGLPFLGAGLYGLYWLFRGATRQLAAGRQANRAWLDAHQEIENELGPVEIPSLIAPKP